MKAGLAIIAVLLFASCAQAQHHSHCGGSFGGGAFGNGGASWGYAGDLSIPTISSRYHALHYEPPREFAVYYDRNDGEYIPSTFMNFDEAVALGREMIAAAQRQKQEVRSVPLAEVARAYRASKDSKLQASLVQGDSHTLEICDLKSSSCRRL
jgi:hypothetical protein